MLTNPVMYSQDLIINCTVLNVICLPQSRLLTQSMQEGTPDIMIANRRGKLTVGDNKMRC